MELVLVLAIPVVGAILLALVGAQQRAAELNVVISFATPPAVPLTNSI